MLEMLLNGTICMSCHTGSCVFLIKHSDTETLFQFLLNVFCWGITERFTEHRDSCCFMILVEKIKQKLFWIQSNQFFVEVRLSLHIYAPFTCKSWRIFMRIYVPYMCQCNRCQWVLQTPSTFHTWSCSFESYINTDFNLLGLGTDSHDFCIKICYNVHIASVGTMVSENTRESHEMKNTKKDK